ncbi:hypothetical protein E2C01_085567 [Portunus trituberculatus]|uniref:Uncharacterized protein n=1 Tax=Portunus trituberculatus TaxID=210409 RepID=A0A5B7J7Y3_PORTR|nr:hypothetical protein [Portunus trituberculatus]
MRVTQEETSVPGDAVLRECQLFLAVLCLAVSSLLQYLACHCLLSYVGLSMLGSSYLQLRFASFCLQLPPANCLIDCCALT